MAAYRADIEIGVRGSSRLKELQDRITRLSRSIEDVNVKTLIDRKAVQSIESYTQALGRASNNLREVTIQLDAAGRASGNYADAISQYVTALGQSNAAQKLQNELIADEIELRRKQKLAASGIRETTQYASPIGPALSPLRGQTSPVEERLRRILQQRRDENQLQEALFRLEQKATGELNRQLEAQESMIRGKRKVLDLIDQAARKSRLQAGGPAPGLQGPLAGPGAMGFPVALPMLREEQKGVEAAAQKLQILQRIKQTRVDLSGLAANLQRLDTQSTVAIADANREQQRLNASRQEALEISANQLKMDLSIARARSSPIEGGLDMPGSPKFLRAKRRRERLSGVALGAGFPLLFGGGPGAVLGGAAGGLVGGPAGFAAQIALSAIGQQVDKFVAEVAKTGVALTSASGTFELVKDKSLFSSEEVKKLAYALEEQGKVQELATLLTSDLAKQIGSQGVLALQDAGKETKEFTRLVNLLFTQLSAFVAGPLADFLSFINKALGSLATNIEFGAFKSSLKGEDAAKFAAIEREVRGTRKQNIRGGKTQSVLGTLTTERQAEILKRATAAGLAPEVTGLTTFEDTQTIRPPKGGKGKSAAEREADRVAKALINQRAITLEIQRQSEFSGKIAAAELAKDPLLARRLQGEQALAELGVQTAKQLELEQNTSVQLAISKTAQAKADAIRKETAQDIAKIEQDRKEKFADVLADLQYQVEYESAVTREKRNQLELDNEARKLNKDGFSPEQTATLVGLKKRLQQQQEPLAKFIKDSQRQLKDLEQVAVNVSQGIGNAIANSMSQGIQGLIEGTKTAQQVFADFLKGVGDVLIQEGTRMIAMYIAIGIAKAFAGLGGGKGEETASEFMDRTANLDLVGGSYPNLMGFAEGGFVTGPTNALIGEGGEPEYVIPASKMRGAMNRYAAGARGSSVIPSGGEQGTGEGGTAVATPIDVRYTVERINSVDYVTADQFQAGMQQAAQQGAAQGEQRTLRRLQMSTSTRKRLGM